MINNLSAAAYELRQQVKHAGITQEQLAEAMSASQSQISRVLSGKGKRRTRLFDNICIYVRNQLKGISIEVVKENEEMLEAIATIWDGTNDHAKSIAGVIKSLGPLCKPGVKAQANTRHKNNN